MSDVNRSDDSNNGKAKWTEADRRLLLITFLGGLGANVGLIFIIGIAYLALNLKGTPAAVFWVVLGVATAFISLFAERVLFTRELSGWKFWVFLYGIYLLFILLIFAVRVSK